MHKRFLVGQLTAVVAAGGTISGEYARTAGCSIRSLVPVGVDRTPVLSHVVQALRSCSYIDKIVVAGPDELAAKVPGVDRWIPDQGSAPKNFFNTIRDLVGCEWLILCVSDLPFVSGSDVDKFVESCVDGAEINVGVVVRQEFMETYRDGPPSEFIRVSGLGEVTLAGVFIVQRSAVLRNEQLISKLIHRRKSQVMTAVLLGFTLVRQWITGTLNKDRLVSHAELLLGCSVSVYANMPPSLAYDIDSIEDWDYADSFLNHLGKK